jgi:hypothetical protein
LPVPISNMLEISYVSICSGTDLPAPIIVTGDWFTTAYDDTSSYISHNPGISILSGLAIVGVTEPLALPWVALGTVTHLL